jgi:hypothetical protein
MIKNCSFCGSDQITEDVKVYCDSGNNFPLRAQYRNPKKAIFRPFLAEYFYAEICNSCGSVVRMYVKTPRNSWETGDY